MWKSVHEIKAQMADLAERLRQMEKGCREPQERGVREPQIQSPTNAEIIGNAHEIKAQMADLAERLRQIQERGVREPQIQSPTNAEIIAKRRETEKVREMCEHLKRAAVYISERRKKSAFNVTKLLFNVFVPKL